MYPSYSAPPALSRQHQQARERHPGVHETHPWLRGMQALQPAPYSLQAAAHRPGGLIMDTAVGIQAATVCGILPAPNLSEASTALSCPPAQRLVAEPPPPSTPAESHAAAQQVACALQILYQQPACHPGPPLRVHLKDPPGGTMLDSWGCWAREVRRSSLPMGLPPPPRSGLRAAWEPREMLKLRSRPGALSCLASAPGSCKAQFAWGSSFMHKPPPSWTAWHWRPAEARPARLLSGSKDSPLLAC